MNNIRFLISLLFLALLSIALTLPGLAEEKPAIKLNADSNEEVEFKLRKEEIMFVPYRELSKLLDKNKKLVFMSYKELSDLINEKSQIRPLAPVNHVIKDLALKGKVQKDFVSFDATYKIEILNKEWVYVPVLSTMVGLKSAEFDGKPAPISTDGSTFRILSEEIGEHTLKLKFDVKLNETGNTKSFNFNMPVLPITRLAIEVPEVPVKLNINNSSGERSEVKDKKTITYANLVGQGNVNVEWKSNLVQLKKPEIVKILQQESKLPSKVLANIETLISVDEGIMQGFSTYRCQIFHKPVEKLTLAIPDDVEIISVSSMSDIVRKGPPVITDPNKDKPGKLLTVYFNSKIKDNASFNIAFEKIFENKKIEESIPTIYLVGKEINKSDGYIAIQSLGNIEIKEIALSNITPDDQLPSSLENSAQNPILLSYQYIMTNTKDFYQLKLEIIPSTDAAVQVAMVDKAQIDSRLSSNGILTTKADYTIRNMSEQYFRFKLPEDAEILTGLINGQPVQVEKKTSSENGTQKKGAKAEDEIKNPEYLINIKNYQDETPFVLSVMYRENKKFNFINHILNKYNLIAPNVLNMRTLTLSWSAYIPHGMKYWYFTELNKGYENYASYIRGKVASGLVSTVTSSGAYDYSGNDRQIMNVAPNAYIENDDNKASGILPPEFSMPPTIGLINVSFADYLLETGSPSVDVIGITGLIQLPIFVLMLILGWLIAHKGYLKITEKTSTYDRAKYFVPVAILLYIAGLIFNFSIIWLPVILSVIAYIPYRFVNNKKMHKETV